MSAAGKASLPIEAAGREGRRGGDRVSGDRPRAADPSHSQPPPGAPDPPARPPKGPSHGLGRGHCVATRLNSYLFLSFAVDAGERRADREHR